jgi:hypothetical protein
MLSGQSSNEKVRKTQSSTLAKQLTGKVSCRKPGLKRHLQIWKSQEKIMESFPFGFGANALQEFGEHDADEGNLITVEKII